MARIPHKPKYLLFSLFFLASGYAALAFGWDTGNSFLFIYGILAVLFSLVAFIIAVK